MLPCAFPLRASHGVVLVSAASRAKCPCRHGIDRQCAIQRDSKIFSDGPDEQASSNEEKSPRASSPAGGLLPHGFQVRVTGRLLAQGPRIMMGPQLGSCLTRFKLKYGLSNWDARVHTRARERATGYYYIVPCDCARAAQIRVTAGTRLRVGISSCQ